MALAAELRGKRVVRAVIAYGVGAFALLQIVEPVMHGLHLPEATLTWTLLAIAALFPLVVAVAWLTDRAQPATHVRPVWLLAAGAGLIAVGIAAALARRNHAALRGPALVQATFEGGIEDYPAWSPGGAQLAYVAQSGPARKIFRRVVGAGEPMQVTRGDADDLQPAWSRDGKKLFFMRAQSASKRLQPGDVFGEFSGADVWQVDLQSGKESLLVANAYDPAVAADGRIAVDASWAGPRRIWVLDANGQNPQQVTTDATEETSHVAPRFSGDGTKIAFQTQERTKFDVRVVDLQTKRQVAITNDFAMDLRPAWSPSGRFVYFSSDRGGTLNIWRAPVSADGAPDGPLQQVTTGAGYDVEPAVSADGRLAFSTLRQNADLYRLPVDPRTGAVTGEPAAVVATTREDSRGAWSPDGGAIAFNSDRGGEMNLWVHSLADGSDRRVTSGAGGDFQPNWSPDGKRLAFFSSRLGRPRIFTVDARGGTPAPLTAGDSIEVNPFFSPDGKWVAYVSDRSGRSELWIVPAAGGAERQLTHDGVAGHFVRWTDASDGIVFNCRCGGHRAIMVAPLAGGDLRRLGEIAAGSHLSFSPDRRLIMDVLGHRVLTVYPMEGGEGRRVFEFADPNARIDYPVWSPDGRWVLFDRNHPEGGDVFILRDVE